MFDIAIHKPTGDWPFALNGDLVSINGDDTVKQRIFIRLKVPKGWSLDPTQGTFGSRLRQATRGPRGRALNEIPLYIREALAPMVDIEVTDVELEELNESSILAKITYAPIRPGALYFVSPQQEVVEVEITV